MLASVTGRAMRAVLIAVVVAAGLGSCDGGTTHPQAFWDSIAQEAKAQYDDVQSATYQDGLLMIRVSGADWSDAGATNLACGTVKPILKAHGVGDQQFAIYDPTGKVIATGSRCG